MALIIIALAAAITGIVAVSLPPPIPSSLPILAGTVFPLSVAQSPNGTPLIYNGSFVYYRGFSSSANGSVTAPPGLCLQLVGAWRATAHTIINGARPELNGTMNVTVGSYVGAGFVLGFESFQPDTITVTQTIQWVAVSCPP